MINMTKETVIEKAAKAIKKGEVVALPTETVYGLGANAYDKEAVSKIFAAKGRPADNPLIVHVDSLIMAGMLGVLNKDAQNLAQNFWPGPLTLVVPSKGLVPDIVTAGLKTIALRMPDNDIALSLISAAQVPIAAPSANKSGSPSPTSAAHVLLDFGDKFMVLDGGECAIGIESTVIELSKGTPVILRPGAVTQNMIESCIGDVLCTNAFAPNTQQAPAAPGMKYRHYAPLAQVTVVEGEPSSAIEAIKYLFDKDTKKGDKPLIMASRENKRFYGRRDILVTGSLENPAEAAKNLYSLLRMADEMFYSHIYFEAVAKVGIGFAVMNRVYKAAAYNIVKV